MLSRTARSWNALRAAIALTALAAGCSSSTDSTDNQNGADYIRFQASGAQVQFVDQVASPIAVSIAQSGAEYTLIVVGGTALTASPYSNIQISVFDISPITTKTYGAFQSSGTGFAGALVTYNVGSVGYDNTAVNSDVQVTIKEITSTIVHGTFSLTVKTKSGASVFLSGGEFVAKRI
jgi:hypothetical protein